MTLPSAAIERAAKAVRANRNGSITPTDNGTEYDVSLATAALTAALGDEFVIVPREPTLEMLVAAQEEWMCVRAAEERGDSIWRAMLAAHSNRSGEG